MDASKNPFAPGAGNPPPELAGRDDILNDIKSSYARAKNGFSSRSFMLLGLRGVGKTVLLNEVARCASNSGCVTSFIESPEKQDLAELLFPLLRKTLRTLSAADMTKDLIAKGFRALRNFARGLKIKVEDVEISLDTTPEPGVADSGDIQFDLPDMFELIGQAAKKQNTAWVLLIDEVQYLNERDMAALLVAMHKMSQEKLPVIFVGAGLPNVTRLAGDAKSYSERLFDWRNIGPLSPEACRRAIQKPLEQSNVSITDDALQLIVNGTDGYPFFIQTWAFYAWNEASTNTITLDDSEKAYKTTLDSLDNGFFQIRLSRVTENDFAYIRAMASLGKGPYQVGKISKAIGKSTSAVSKQRDSLLKKGIIYSPAFGLVDFSVPLFSEFLSRMTDQKRLQR